MSEPRPIGTKFWMVYPPVYCPLCDSQLGARTTDMDAYKYRREEWVVVRHVEVVGKTGPMEAIEPVVSETKEVIEPPADVILAMLRVLRWHKTGE